MITHRIVAIEHNAGSLAFVTKGDANEDPASSPVTASSVRGRVVFDRPPSMSIQGGYYTAQLRARVMVLEVVPYKVY